jgi:hypothetical protein
VFGEIGVDGGLQIGDRAEPAAAGALARHFGEKALDGIEPGGGGRGEVEGPARMARQPRQHPAFARAGFGMFMSSVVVEHDVDRLASGDLALDGVEKADELDVAVGAACSGR